MPLAFVVYTSCVKGYLFLILFCTVVPFSFLVSGLFAAAASFLAASAAA